ncbi:MAG: hypothetical protein M3352_06285 [Bacteroidota bacterium]|nr:hypothetical protein [Bacteroidota bacterium]
MRYFFSILFICFINIAYAQNNNKLQAISFEIGKTGIIYNLNYDHKFYSKNFGFRVGIGSNPGRYLQLLSVGGGGYYLFGSTNKFFELGGDLNYLSVDEISDDQKGFANMVVYPNYSTKTYYASLNAGFRKYYKKNLFRVGIAPGFTKDEFIPGGYISFGITFN